MLKICGSLVFLCEDFWRLNGRPDKKKAPGRLKVSFLPAVPCAFLPVQIFVIRFLLSGFPDLL